MSYLYIYISGLTLYEKKNAKLSGVIDQTGGAMTQVVCHAITLGVFQYSIYRTVGCVKETIGRF